MKDWRIVWIAGLATVFSGCRQDAPKNAQFAPPRIQQAASVDPTQLGMGNLQPYAVLLAHAMTNRALRLQLAESLRATGNRSSVRFSCEPGSLARQILEDAANRAGEQLSTSCLGLPTTVALEVWMPLPSRARWNGEMVPMVGASAVDDASAIRFAYVSPKLVVPIDEVGRVTAPILVIRTRH